MIEVLVAAGVLFIVSTAVVGLSNSIVQGTSNTNDKTQVSLWAQSGLDLMAKVRDDHVAKGDALSSTGDPVWLPQAENGSTPYGWYAFSPSGDCKSWTLNQTPLSISPVTGRPAQITIADAITNAEPLQGCNTGTSLAAYRLICVEAYATVDQPDNASNLNCNSANSAGTSTINDGNRGSVGSDCQTGTGNQPNDAYCQFTKTSLNRDNLTTNTPETPSFIPPGNALKVRSVIVWQGSGTQNYKSFDLATVMTNWKTIGNI